MESNNNSISVEIPNYSGPLEVLLELAKTQNKLADISITILQIILDFIKKNKKLI